MALSIDWTTKVINVPRTDMLLIQSVPSEIRQLDLDAFRLELKEIEGSEEGQPFLDTHSHNTTVTVGGVTLARVIEIINGYTVTFEDGQYAVNLVGANSNIADVTNVNQVSVRSANSAGLTYSDAINKQSFTNASVYIDIEDGLAGTSFPRGTPSDPVNNYADAKIIAEFNGYEAFDLEGSLELSGQNLADQEWRGHGPLHTHLRVVGCEIEGMTLNSMSIGGTSSTGTVISAKECLIQDWRGFFGALNQCLITGPITVCNCATGILSINFSSSHVPGQETPVLDVNDGLCDLEMRHYAGGMEIRNMTQGNNMSIDMVAGHIKIAETCTSGYILIRGNCKVTDLTTGTNITVNTDHVVNSQVAAVKTDTSLIPATL